MYGSLRSWCIAGCVAALLWSGCDGESSCGEGYSRGEDGSCVLVADAGAEGGGVDASPDAGCAERLLYRDADGDGYGGEADVLPVCEVPDGYVETGGDCDDARSEVHPDGVEFCNGLDDDCDGETDEAGAEDIRTFYRDADGDGHGDPAGAVEDCAPPDGYVADGTDCNDAHAEVHPGAAETCNGLDDDCDGETDEADAEDIRTFYLDADGDGHGDGAMAQQGCSAPSGYVADGTDCDDAHPEVNPGAAEVCDGLDNDCDGRTDEGVRSRFYEDADGDGYGDPSRRVLRCSAPSGYVADGTDCDDAHPEVNPGAAEVCDGLDDDCDGQTDEAGAVGERSYYADCDEDGFAAFGAEHRVVCPSRLPAVPASCAGGVGRWTTQAPSAGTADCDDQEPKAFPGSTHWAIVPRSNGSFDYDCDGTEQRRWLNPSARCSDFTTRADCEAPDHHYVLWHVSTPTECGYTYSAASGRACSWDGVNGTCVGTPVEVTQMCH